MRTLLLVALAMLALVSCVHTEAEPLLSPMPWQVSFQRGTVPLASPVVVVTVEPSSMAAKEVSALVSECTGMRPVMLRPGASIPFCRLLILLSEKQGKDMEKLAGMALPTSVNWGAMGDQGYALQIGAGSVGSAVMLAANSGQGLFYGVQTLKQLVDRSRKPARLTECTIVDRPSVETRGIKGLRWKPEQYKEMMTWLPGRKMNFFMLCYTMYPENAAEWRKPYSPEQLRDMKEIAGYCAPRYVKVCLAINPSINAKPSLIYSSDRDLQDMMNKLKSAYDAGIRSFAICFDDIDFKLQYEEDKDRFDSLAEAQANFMRRLASGLDKVAPGSDLVFCPTTYTSSWATRGDAESRYIHDIGRDLLGRIKVFWTGREVRSVSITSEDAHEFGLLIQRKPFVWDNYPVNDDGAGYLRLGPVKNRSKDLGRHISGWISNPMIQSEASKIPIATVADYTWNTEGYEPVRSLRTAVRQLAGDEAYEDLLAVAELYSPFYGEEPRLPDMSQIRATLPPEEARAAAKLLEPILDRLETYPSLKRMNEDILPVFSSYVSALKRRAGLTSGKPWTSDGVSFAGNELVGGAADLHGSLYQGVASCNWVYAKNTGYSTMTAEFTVEGSVAGQYVLKIDAMDDDPEAPCQVRISVNGQTVLEGPSGFPNGSWAVREFAIRSDLLKVGLNSIKVENLHETGSSDHPPWFMVRKVEILPGK